MKMIDVTVANPLGLHARNIVLLNQAAAAFQSNIYLRYGNRTEGLNNIMGLMGLQVACGDSVTFIMEGADEEAAMTAFEALCQEHL